MPNQRVSVTIRKNDHAQVVELAALTGHNITALVDIAMRNFVKDVAPVLRRAAEQINGK